MIDREAIARLQAELAEARVDAAITALQWIADAGYVDHKSGNENFEYLQNVARDAIRAALENRNG